jgi:hypothetical protein
MDTIPKNIKATPLFQRDGKGFGMAIVFMLSALRSKQA